MYTTLFFKESLLLSCVIFLLIILSSYANMPVLNGILLTVFWMCIYFYRYDTDVKSYDDNIIVSPNEGKITSITTKNGNVCISTYMDFLNNHTQIYPVNGTVINRYYDKTGKYELVINKDKSRYNEKKIHTIQTNNGIVTVTQIAGYFPRCISSSDKIPEKVNAGQYMGMIKFGSRVDIEFMGDVNKLKLKIDDIIKIGDILYKY